MPCCELINFAHADVFMMGSMIGMQFIVTLGVTAQSGVLAKALGYPRVKAYAGSWGEWGNHPDTPIER